MAKKQIHPRAVVAKGAKIGKNVKIGPNAVIGAQARIGDGTIIEAGAQVLDYADVGKNCHIFPYAVIGNVSQDLKYKDCRSYLILGDGCTVREFVTLHRGTEPESATTIGHDNLIMAYSHIAHDCKVGNNNIFSNCATLAGHVELGDHVVIGGLAAIHQFCRVGDLAIIGGCSKIVQDVPPYSMCDGHPAVVRGLNLVGLRRAKFPTATVTLLKKAFKIVFFEDHPFDTARDIIKTTIQDSREVEKLLEFLATSRRGIIRR